MNDSNNDSNESPRLNRRKADDMRERIEKTYKFNLTECMNRIVELETRLADLEEYVYSDPNRKPS